MAQSKADRAVDLFDDGDGGSNGAEGGVDPRGGGDACKSISAAEFDGDANGGGFAAEGGGEEAGWLIVLDEFAGVVDVYKRQIGR